jgi:uncharacterized protein (TIGR03067 family)
MHRVRLTSLTVLVVLSAPAFTRGGDAKQPDAKAEAIKRDLRRLVGTWEVVFTGINGGEFKLPGQEKPDRIIIRTDGSSKVEGAPKWTPAGWLSIDPTARPKTWTTYSKGGTTVGIYEFMSEDELHLCYSFRDRPRPNDFTFKGGSHHVFEIWRRVKDKK